MAPKPLSDVLCKQALKLFHKYDGNCQSGAMAAGITRPSFRHRVEQATQRFPDLAAKLEPKPKTIVEHAVEQRSRSDAASANAKLKDALKEISRLQDRLDDLSWAHNTSFSPAKWSLAERAPKKREHTPYLLTSDFQLGEVIRAEETEAGYGYDSQIFRRRYRRLIETTIYLSGEHAGSTWRYPGIIYSRGGDTISGGIHEELRETDDLTPLQACEVAFEEESAGIEKLAEAFGRVDVKTPGSAGNHDRNTFKPQSKKAFAHSYDRIIHKMLANHFRHDKRVTFQTSESFDVYFPIYSQKILLTHGDRLGSRGGQGMIGPMATILRGAQKTIMEQSALGRHVDQIHHGHFHTEAYNGWVLSNGCLPGFSEYAKSFRMRPSPPTQWLVYYHPKRGAVDLKSINVVSA